MTMERPILFSGPMVRAILEGKKTQTRRVMKPQPELKPGTMTGPTREQIDTAYWHWGNEWWWQDPQQSTLNLCPYGQPGDSLWVRETWTQNEDSQVLYRADWLIYENKGMGWKPSIFMPRWASRITLRVVGVRVERVQDISESDAQAEGVPADVGSIPFYGEYKDPFYRLWDSINSKRPGCSWRDNPWVFVVEFERI